MKKEKSIVEEATEVITDVVDEVIDEPSMNPEDWDAQTTFEEQDIREFTEESGGDLDEAND